MLQHVIDGFVWGTLLWLKDEGGVPSERVIQETFTDMWAAWQAEQTARKGWN